MNARTEVLAGATTFLTMAYIIFVHQQCSPEQCSALPRAWTSARSRRIAMIGGYPPITAPALTILGAMIMQNVTKIHRKD